MQRLNAEVYHQIPTNNLKKKTLFHSRRKNEAEQKNSISQLYLFG
jgi:hypothetical protein